MNQTVVWDVNDGVLPAINPQTGQVNGYFRSIRPTDVGPGFDVANISYPGWCGDLASTGVSSGLAGVYSTYAALPAEVTIGPIAWNKVNYILNHKRGTVNDVQRAIWDTILSGNDLPITTASTAMVAAANANPNYIPGPGGVVAVMLFPFFNPRLQDLLIEVPVPPCGSIGDFVWHDQSRDGLQQPGEPGIDGVTVNLKNASGVTVCSTVTTTFSGNAGFYRFLNLDAGNYTVEIPTPPAGKQATYSQVGAPANAATDSNGSPAPVTLATRGASDDTIDFGYYTPCSGHIGDFVWNDLNRNGIQDPGEPGLQNVKLSLLTQGGVLVAGPVTTGPGGVYDFPGVCPGTYQVVVDASTVPSGFSATTPNVPGSTSINDSNGSPAIVTLPADNSTDASIDFGYVAPCTGTIGNFIWHDQNRDGIQDGSEPGLNGVVLRLMMGSTVMQTVTSGPAPSPLTGNGYYQFSNVCPATYTVEVASVPSGYTRTAVNAAGSNPGNDSNPTPYTLTFAGPSDQTVDFGFSGACSGILGDLVWNDINKNGIQDPGEPGIAGVTVNLRKTDLSLIASTTTDGNGAYSFGARCTGEYRVEAIPPAGWAASTPNAPGSTTANDANPNPAPVTLTTDLAQDLTIDFGYYAGSIGDRVWNDANGNGVQDIGEAGLTPWTVTISGTSLPSGYLTTRTTGVDGIYNFTGLPAGSYTVCVTPQTGWTQTYDLDGLGTAHCAAASLAAGQNRADVDFGYRQIGSIGDRVWNDANGNGAQDGGEAGINGVTVQLKDASGAVIATATTAGDGIYGFPNLAPGTYTVCVLAGSAPLAGMTQTSDLDGLGTAHCAAASLAAGQSRADVDFGYRTPPPTAVCALTWGYWKNHVGQWPVTTLVLGSQTYSQAELIALFGKPVAGDVSISLAHQLIAAKLNVANGTPLSTANGAVGAADTILSTYSGKLPYGVASASTAGAQMTTIAANLDFFNQDGLAQPGCVSTPGGCEGSIGDYVWKDLNGNGIQDLGEPGVAGITVNLRSTAGALLATATTSASGLYQFTGLCAGTYVVEVVTGSAYSLTKANAVGSTQANDSNPNLWTVALATRASSDYTVDFGLIGALQLNCGTCGAAKAVLGKPYTENLEASGGKGPYTYAIIDGALPPGITLNPSTGAVTGTPTAAGTYTFTAQVTDANGNKDTSVCTMVVVVPPVDLTCGTCGASKAYIGQAYSATLSVSGGKAPYTFAVVSGSLPPGLTLNPATGAIAGTPTTAGTYTFTTKVTDANGSTDTAVCTIKVLGSPVNLECGTCGSGKGYVGRTYSATLSASGGTGPYTYSIVSGALPAGLTLNRATGAITGTPTTAGSYTFTAKVVDSRGNSDTSTCTIVVAGSPVNLDCGTCGAGKAYVGAAYVESLTASGGVAPYTFSIVSGSLPAGLALSSSTGRISGTPTAAGTYTFTAKAVDSRGNLDTATCTVIVTTPAVNLECGSCSSAPIKVGTAYSSILSVTGGTPGYTFSIVSGTLPAGLTLNSSTGRISGTPTLAGTFTFTAKVTDSKGVSDTMVCRILVTRSAVNLECGACAGKITKGAAYSSTLQVTGGTGPYAFSIVSGSLPAGLALSSSTGRISGTPTAAGTFTFTARVTDSRGNPDTVTCTLTVAVSSVHLDCGACGASYASVGKPFVEALEARGGSGSYIYSIVSGSLPAGLTLNPATGRITGTPTAAGSYTFTAKATASSGGSDTDTCTIVVTAPPVDLSCGACGGAKVNVGSAYSANLTATGGAGGYVYSIVSGSLPAGLTLNPATGRIGGTPAAAGTYTFTAKAMDSRGKSDTATCTITVVAPIDLACGTCGSGKAYVGVTYSAAMSVRGGTAPFTYSIASGSLPAGLILNASGQVGGRPTASGAFTFTVKVVDSKGASDTATCTLTVASTVNLECGTCGAGKAYLGSAYSEQLEARGGTGSYTYSVVSGSLPAGIVLNPATGRFSGTPAAAGTFTFTAKAVDGQGNSDTATCTIMVAAPPLRLECGSCGSSKVYVGRAVSVSPAVKGGSGPYAFSIVSGAVPAGMTLNSATGVVSGTPATAGTYTFTTKVVDSKGASDTATCTIVAIRQ